VAAYAGIGWSPTMKALQALVESAEPPFTCEATETRIAFLLHGRERWVIDTRWFGGRPVLTCQRSPGRIRVELAGAVFPGTQLPADFVCDIRQAMLLWRMDLAFRLGTFHARTPFVRWLTHKETARSDVHLSNGICNLGADGDAHLSGHASADFTPDWIFTVRGGRVAGIRGLGGYLESDFVRIVLLDPHAPSLVTHATGPRTLMTFQRATRTWVVEPGLSVAGPGRLSCPENVFQTLHLETFQGPGGRAGSAVLAEGAVQGAQSSFEVGRGLAEWGGEPVHLPLVGARFVKFFKGPGAETEQAFLANYADAPVVLRLQGCSVHLGNAPGTPLFELSANGGGTHVCCEPAVHRVHVPIAGAIAEPFAPPPGTRLNLNLLAGLDRPAPTFTAAPIIEQKVLPGVTQGTAPQAPKPPSGPAQGLGAQQMQIQPGIAAALAPTEFRAVMAFTGPFTVPVIRPEDLLVLKFEFRNMTLSVGPGKPPMVVRGQAGPRPLLIVHVPPQNIGEQAFFEVSKDCANKTVVPKPLPTNTPNAEQNKLNDAQNKRNEAGGGEACRFPIRASLAGWSRLVFQLPDNLPGLAFSLPNVNDVPGLLDWSRLEPVLANNAAPPPDPPLQLYIVDPDIVRGPAFKAPAMPMQPAPPTGMQPFKRQSMPLPKAQPDFRWQEVRGPARAFERAQVWLASDHRYLVQFGGPTGQLKTAEIGVVPLFVSPVPPKKEDLPNVTSIEAPYRLFMSPNKMGGWAHSLAPVQLNGRFELWHSRLGVRRQDQQGRWYVDERDPWYRTLRAIWSPDFDPNRPNDANAWRSYAASAEKWQHFSAAAATKWNPFRMSLDCRDRNELVHLTGDGTLYNAKWQGRVAKVEQFMLSSLGAWVRLRYAGDIPLGTPLTVEEWRHRGTMGRDHYVRVVYKGYLFPFGHRCSLVKVTERKFEEVDKKIVACLRQRMFIVVREPVKAYPARNEGSAPSKGRSFPYDKVKFRTLVTPNLDDPTLAPSAIPGGPPQEVFWPHVCGNIFRFNLAAEDQAGRVSEFSLPCAFVSNAVAYAGNVLHNLMPPPGINPSYLPGPPGRNIAELNSQKIAYAPMQSGMDTVLETIQLIFGAEMPGDINGLEAAGQPFFYPIVHQAKVRVPPVQELLGDSTPIAVRYATAYKNVGLTPNGNQGALYLELIEKLGLGFASDKSGGVATPNMDVTALSALRGPVGGDPAKFAAGQFNPKEFFNHSPTDDPKTPQEKAAAAKSARLLGGISLADIIVPGSAGEAPQLTTERTGAAATGAGGGVSERSVDASIVTKLHFETMKLQKDPLNLFNPDTTNSDQSKRSKLTLDAKITVKFSTQGQPVTPEFDVSGDVTHFELNLFKMIVVKFNKLAFKKEHGKNLDCDPDIDDVKFGGPLAFVQKLADALGGGSDKKSASLFPDLVPRVRPVNLVLTGGKEPKCEGQFAFKLIKDFSPKAIKAGFVLCIPDVTVGVMSLTNMRASAAAELQLLSLVMGLAKEIDDLSWDTFKKAFEKAFTVTVGFSTRQDPFHIRVYIFGGGGFFALKLGTAGLQILEVALEFGGMFDLNLGVAKGEVHLFAGFYFKMEKKEIDACVGGKMGKKEVMSITFEGYVRAGGHINILGIITVSIELKLSLTYESVGGQSKLWGEASLTIEVEILFFSVSVEVKVRKEFAGSGSSGVSQTCALEDDSMRFANFGARAYRMASPGMPQQMMPQQMMPLAAAPPPPPPKVVDLVSKKEWDRYAAAFAAE